MKTKLLSLVGTSAFILVVVLVILAFTNKTFIGMKEAFSEPWEMITVSTKPNSAPATSTKPRTVDVTVEWKGDYRQVFVQLYGPARHFSPSISNTKRYTITNLQPGRYMIMVVSPSMSRPASFSENLVPIVQKMTHAMPHLMLSAPQASTTQPTTPPTPTTPTPGSTQPQTQSSQFPLWNIDPFRQKLKQVSHSGNTVCGVTDTNQIMCNHGTQWRTLPGLLKHISIDGNRACGVNANNEIFCADNLERPDWHKLPGALKQVDLNGNDICGVNTNNEIFCSKYKDGKWSKKGGLLEHISISRGRACGTTKNNEIFCADNIESMPWQKVGGLLKQIDLTNDNMCGVNAGGDLFCSKYKSGAWKKVAPFQAQHVSVDTNSAYAIDNNKDVQRTFSIGI